MKEAELVENYITFRKKLDPNIIVIKERGYRQKKIDLIEIDLNTNLNFHGIEFKIKNWRLGLKQCLGNRILVPYNSLAIYYKYESNIHIEEISKHGIGLIIICDDDYKQKIPPRKNDLLNLNKYHQIYEKIRRIYPETLIN
ncbi:MAG: hypothetical protein ACXACX_15370 [Candidatus Hodarchaeales archaeon]|jgi:hypothetical protein